MPPTAAAAAGSAIVEEIDIAAPAERIFDALTTPEQLRRWWGREQMYTTEWDVDLRVGGGYRCRATGADGSVMIVEGRFLEVDRPLRLGYTWNASWDPTGETTVVYELAPRGESTHLRVTHGGFAPGADRAGYTDGWARVLAWLTEFVSA